MTISASQGSARRSMRAPQTQQALAPIQESALISVKEVCALVGLQRSAVLKRVRAGVFPAPIRLSERCSRWKTSAIREWLDAQQ